MNRDAPPEPPSEPRGEARVAPAVTPESAPERARDLGPPAPAERWSVPLLLLGVVLLVPLGRPLFGLGDGLRIALGLAAWGGFLVALPRVAAPRRRVLVALFAPLALLAAAPVNTDLSWSHMAVLGSALALAIVVPALILRGRGVLDFRFWPRRLDWVDVGYTLLSIPLAWAAFELYFKVLSPEVPFNWPLPAQPDSLELFKLFGGINAVGIWDELFFVNTCYACFRALYPAPRFSPWVANLAQSVIYTAVLWDMAFSGWGPLFVLALAITQGLMYERSKVLLWVLLVHLIVDYFLFQAIVDAYYPDLTVWWHP